MCRVGDAARLRAAAKHAYPADKLEHKPDPDGNDGGNLPDRPHNDDPNSTPGMKNEVAPEHFEMAPEAPSAGRKGFPPNATVANTCASPASTPQIR